MGESISVISKGSFFSGDVCINGTVDISGNIKGNIVANAVFVKDNGFVDGKIVAQEVVVSNGGKVKGEIITKSFKTTKGAEVNGKINYFSLSMEDGVKLVGSCEVIDEETVATKINELKQKFNTSNEE